MAKAVFRGLYALLSAVRDLSERPRQRGAGLRQGRRLRVVGMGRTVPATESAIGALGDPGIPLVATTLTGQGLGDRSPLYFQLVPGNEKQVALLREYSRRLGKEVTVYQPADVEGDSYLKTLRRGLDGVLGADGSWLVAWRGPVRGVEPRCDTAEVDRIAYYAGREYDFDGFLDTLYEECEDRTPVVVGNDTTSRFGAGSRRAWREFGRKLQEDAVDRRAGRRLVRRRGAVRARGQGEPVQAAAGRRHRGAARRRRRRSARPGRHRAGAE